ncbi:SIR2 family protein [Terricaulis sp.]|uniref:argonaute/piwi family protein n=1 Tax=Terricaulis sp. TaxID=2768686 RepID=UPI00378483F2
MSTAQPNRSVTAQTAEDTPLTLDALVRSLGVRKGTPHTLFIGAGASVSSGVPSADACIWEWKRNLFLTNNPGLEEQFRELSLPSVRQRIQQWLDKQGTFPCEGSPGEYGFYIRACFPIADDRRAYFQTRSRGARPHIGYRLLCHLAQEDIIRSVWSPNFDGLPARAAADFSLSALEVGIDTQQRLSRPPSVGELLCVSMHGDYRYDELRNTPDELQKVEAALRAGLADDLKQHSLIVCGYSGRDASIMETLEAAYSQRGTGVLYWCGYSDADAPECVRKLIAHARANGRQAYYVPALGFDDLMTRLALHCLDGKAREEARKEIAAMAPADLLARQPFKLPTYPGKTIIKSNAFEIECPSEVFAFELKTWPTEKVWSWLRDQIGQRQIVAAPLKGKVVALGTLDDINDAFRGNILGSIGRTPVNPEELKLEDGAIVGIMRQALARSMAEAANLSFDGRSELWDPKPHRQERGHAVHESFVLFLRRIGQTQYAVLKPSLKIVDRTGKEVPPTVASPIKLRILGYQHNKEFNAAVNKWRQLLLGANPAVFEFPSGVASGFKFRLRRSPVFAQIGLPNAKATPTVSDKLRPLIKYDGVELPEPRLVFSDRTATSTKIDTHPIRGVLENRPFDFPLTLKGLASTLRIGVICAKPEGAALERYLQTANTVCRPNDSERDYLLDYPGFQTAFGLPLEIPTIGSAGWVTCNEPASSNPKIAATQVAQNITAAIETLRSTYAPHVTIILTPARWNPYREYRDEYERFDVHDFVKAYGVQRGAATQFLDEETLTDGQPARVWWWLSLALYAKGMRTPWVLDGLDGDTAYIGLGFSLDAYAKKGSHVVLGCSHIYSSRGEGLQYRLSKVENPIILGKNPFMSRDDARRTGETIRQLFFDARMKLPRRVVLHKKTRFTIDEREGFLDGLGGVEAIDMLEIQEDSALRFMASITRADGSIDEDGYPVRRGTVMRLDDYSALLWLHGATQAVNLRKTYFQGKRRIPSPLTVRRHAGATPLDQLCREILGLSKMNWNTFDLYTKMPATLQSSSEIARIGALLQRFGASSYDYRLFI